MTITDAVFECLSEIEEYQKILKDMYDEKDCKKKITNLKKHMNDFIRWMDDTNGDYKIGKYENSNDAYNNRNTKYQKQLQDDFCAMENAHMRYAEKNKYEFMQQGKVADERSYSSTVHVKGKPKWFTTYMKKTKTRRRYRHELID